MKRVALALIFATAGGCAGIGSTPQPRTFDLGIGAPQARLQPLGPVTVRATAPFDGLDMHYRLAWRNAAELSSFTQSRWAATPAELLRKQLLRASAEGLAKCGLEIELQEFTQLFSVPNESEARIEFRAALVGPKMRVAARGWSVSEANAGAGAASGAGAFARATDRAVSEIAAWVGAQADCR